MTKIKRVLAAQILIIPGLAGADLFGRALKCQLEGLDTPLGYTQLALERPRSFYKSLCQLFDR